MYTANVLSNLHERRNGSRRVTFKSPRGAEGGVASIAKQLNDEAAMLLDTSRAYVSQQLAQLTMLFRIERLTNACVIAQVDEDERRQSSARLSLERESTQPLGPVLTQILRLVLELICQKSQEVISLFVCDLWIDRRLGRRRVLRALGVWCIIARTGITQQSAALRTAGDVAAVRQDL